MNSDTNTKADLDDPKQGKLSSVQGVHFQLIGISVVLATMIFIFDINLPLGVAAGVPYVALVLIGVWFPKTHHVYRLAIFGSALTILGYLVSPSGGVLWVVLANRGLALCAIWVAAVLIASRKKYENDLRLARDNLELEVEARTAELFRTEEQYRDIVEGSNDLITVVKGNGCFQYVNHKARAIFGIEPQECVGRLALDFVHPDDREMTHAAFQGWIKDNITNTEFQNRQLSHDGSVFNMLWSVNIRYDQNGKVELVRSIARNITERLIVEKQLAENLKELDFQKFAIDEHAIVSITDVQGKIIYANEKFCDISGYSIDELIGQNHRIIKSEEHPFEFFKDIWDVISNGDVWHGEIKNIAKNGEGYWVMSTIVPSLNEKGKPFQYISIRTDVTKRKEAEIQAMTASRIKSDLMANMSHELRTPLNAIIGFSDTIKSEVFGSLGNDKYREYIDDIHYSGKHLLELINDILDVSAIEAGAIKLHEENISISNVINSSIRIIQPRADEGQVIVTSSICPDTPLIHADERRLKQVFLNLLSNAVKFTPKGGEVAVNSWFNENGSFSIAVADTGMGMDKHEIRTALSAFGQVDSGLDRKHEGTGLGLPLTKGLMEQHGGTLNVKSTKGKGTQVIVNFPKERVV